MILLPLMDAQRGRLLFASKGCVLCHSINGAGGKLGPSLDASEERPYIDVLDFAARMWRGAFAMAEFQAIEIGYQIELEGDELGDLAAFIYGIEQQRTFSEDEIPDLIKEWIVEEPYSLPDNLFE
jgi:cytochrome c